MPRITPKRAGLALAATSLLMGLVYLGTPRAPSPVPPSAPTPTAVNPQAMARIEAKATQTARERLAKMPEPVVPQGVGGFSREEITRTSVAFQEMLSVQGLYNQHLSRQRTIERLLESPRGAEIASRTLTDLAFAREAFGELQAEARLFSIAVLKTAAQRGEEAPLLRSSTAIAQQLSQTDDGATPMDAGRSADLRDMVRAVIEVKRVEAFSEGNLQLVRDMGYSPSLSPRVKSMYDEILFSYLKHQYGRERATAMTAALLDS
jgi:hypothetical protein